MTLNTFKTAGLTLLALMAWLPSSQAQTWEPAKNVEIVVYAAPRRQQRQDSTRD